MSGSIRNLPPPGGLCFFTRKCTFDEDWVINVQSCPSRQPVRDSDTVYATHFRASAVLIRCTVLMLPTLTIIITRYIDLPRVMFEHRLRIGQKSITKLYSLTASINCIVIALHLCHFSVKCNISGIYIYIYVHNRTTPTSPMSKSWCKKKRWWTHLRLLPAYFLVRASWIR